MRLVAKKPDNRYIRYYTVGSAARELAPERLQQSKTAAKPRRAKRVTLYVDPVAVLGIATAVFMTVCMTIGLVQLGEARAQRAVMSNYVQQLNGTNAQLITQYHDSIDLQQIEASAKMMGMVPAEQVEHIAVSLSAD